MQLIDLLYDPYGFWTGWALGLITPMVVRGLLRREG